MTRWLIVTTGSGSSTFDPTTVVQLGRAGDAHVRVADPRASAAHAEVACDATGTWVLSDRSRHGTFDSHGNAVTELPLGDQPVRVRLADAEDGPEVTFLVRTGPEAASRPRPASSPAEEWTVHASELLVTWDGGVRRFPAGRVVSVGRRTAADVVVTDRRVSRDHVRFDHDPSDGWVATSVDGRPMFASTGPVERLVIPPGGATIRLAEAADGPTLNVSPTSAVAAPPAPPAPPAGDPVTADERLGRRRPMTAGPLRAGLSQPGSAHSILAVEVPVVRIGRAPDNDVVISDDLTVSRRHAELRRVDDGWEIVDLESTSGTYLDGIPVRRSAVLAGQLIGVGRQIYELVGDELVEYVDDAASLSAHEVTVTVGGRNLVERVTFAATPGQMIAVVGPTGAGKSTLLRALTGFAPATSGSVTYNGRDLYAAAAEFRHRIGYVPQDDICHRQLRLRAALRFAAELRFEADTSAIERDERVDEVLDELGLAHRTTLPISQLSGGQRKRASVALELLTRPALLFLDEPTSGLDPGYERSVTELLRELADGGRTVILITHSVASLALCDRVLFLAPGGRMAYYGPPAEALQYFATDDYAEVFNRLDVEQRDWPAELRADASFANYVAGPEERADRARTPSTTPPPATVRSVGRRQLWTLVRRNFAVLRGSGGYAALLVAQAPAVAGIMLVALGRGALVSSPDGNSRARAMLMVVTVAVATMGSINSCREIVKELAVYRRERAVGLSIGAYVLSKFLFLAVLVAIQVAFIVALVLALQGGPADAVQFGWPLLELAIVLFAVGMAAGAIGLLLSAVVSTDSAALVAVPVLIIAQIVLSGAVLRVEDRPGLEQAAWVTPAYWGFAAEASSADLLVLDQTCSLRTVIDESGDLIPTSARTVARGLLGDLPCSPHWTHDRASFWRALVPLIALTVLFGCAAGLALHLRDPTRRRRSSTRRPTRAASLSPG